jgi:pyridoxal/pyridoxine/pyridoxamine kinase
MARPVGHDSPPIFAALQWSSIAPHMFSGIGDVACAYVLETVLEGLCGTEFLKMPSV